MNFPAYKHPWFGIWPVMLTPMHADRSIDYEALDVLTEWYIDAGVAGLFTCSQTGESFKLTDQEKLQITERVMRRAAGRVPVVAGAIGYSTEKSRVHAARQFADLGVACVVLVAGEFAAADEDDATLSERLQCFADLAPDVNFGLYECPQPYHRFISPAAVQRLVHSGRFLWLKETSRNLELQQAKVNAMDGSRACLFNAYTMYLRRSLEIGCTGHCGIASNISPILCCALCNPDASESQVNRWLKILGKVHAAVMTSAYPATVKALAGLRGLPIATVSRVVQSDLNDEKKSQLVQLCRELEHVESELLDNAEPEVSPVPEVVVKPRPVTTMNSKLS